MARGPCAGFTRRRWGGLRCGRWCGAGCFRAGLAGGCGGGGAGGGWGHLCGSLGSMRGNLSAGWGSLARSMLFSRASSSLARARLKERPMGRCFPRMGGIWGLRMCLRRGRFTRKGRCLTLMRCWGMRRWRSVTGVGRWCARVCARWTTTGFISQSGGGLRRRVC